MVKNKNIGKRQLEDMQMPVEANSSYWLNNYKTVKKPLGGSVALHTI